MKNADKSERQAAILAIVRGAAVGRQDEIVARLRARGFDVTQASVSRDLRELGLVKAAGRYVRLADLPPARGPLPPPGVVGVLRGAEPVGPHLVVVRTSPGHASTVAIELDQQGLTGVVGTIAGDDTIFVAVRGPAGRRRLLDLLRGWAAAPATTPVIRGGAR